MPDLVKRKVVDFALQETELSQRERAVTFTNRERYFVSESTVCRTLKAHDLITSPAVIVPRAANEFKEKTTGINQLLQTDFTYIKGWGWLYLCIRPLTSDQWRTRAHSSTTTAAASSHGSSATIARQGIAQQCSERETGGLKTLPIRWSSP